MITFQDLPNSPWSARANYLQAFPEGKLTDFPQTPVGAPSGPGLWVNPLDKQIWNVDANLYCKRVIGTYRIRGDRNGAGSQALISPGGFYGIANTIIKIKDGRWLFTDTGNQKIKAIANDGKFTVSDFCPAPGQCDTIIEDADGNIWVFQNYGSFFKHSKDGTLTGSIYPGVSRVWQGSVIDNQGRITVNSKQNSCSQLWEFIPSTGKITLLAGISEEDHDLLPKDQKELAFDGPATKAFIFTAGIVYQSPDGEETRCSAGDTGNCRRFLRSTGRVDTWFDDDSWRETMELRGGAHTYAAYGKQPITGWPYSTRAWYEQIGSEGTALFKKIIIIPNQPGGSMFKGTFVSQKIPTQMNVGEIVPVEVTYKNDGDQPWTIAGKFRLGSWNPQDNSIWTFPVSNCRVELPADVAPGASVTFKFNVKVPATVGNYNLQAKMMQDGPASWFGDATPNVVVNVTAVTAPVPPTTQTATLALTISGKLTIGTAAPIDIPPTITSIDVTIG